jgi:hypothetical protein
MTLADAYFILLLGTYGPTKGLAYWEQEWGIVTHR